MENINSGNKQEVSGLDKSRQEREMDIEKFLESTPMDENVQLLEVATSGNLEKLSKFYDNSSNYVRSILSVVVFAVASHGALAQEGPTNEEAAQDVTYEMHLKQKTEMKDLVGYDIEDEAKKVNRKVTLYKSSNSTNATIVFLGQTHRSIDPEVNLRSNDQISRSQKEIANFLSVTTSSKTKVFIEGFYVDGKTITFDDLQPSLHINDFLDFKPAEKADTPKRIVEGVFTPLILKGQQLACNLGIFGIDFSKGVNWESFSANYKAKIDQNMKAGESATTMVFDMVFTPPNYNFIYALSERSFCKEDTECNRITKEIIEQNIPKARKILHDDREDDAVELIADQVKTGQKVFPLVYGSGHNFTRAVKKWNESHPDKSFNLITVKSDLDK